MAVYYSPASSNAFIPLSLLYTFVAHLWLSLRHGSLWRQKLVATLPPPPQASSTNSSSAAHPRPAKIAIVTGANTGIGYQTARTLVKAYGYHVILACRSKDKALQAQQRIQNDETGVDEDDGGGRAIVLDSLLDLTDATSIHNFVADVKRTYPDGIEVLINNAGRNTSGELRSTSSPSTSSSSPALDLMFASNYLGHFLLTKLLLERSVLRKKERGDTNIQSKSIIINVSSVMHHFNDGDGTFVWDQKATGDDTEIPSSSDNNMDIALQQQLQQKQVGYWKSRAYYETSQSLPDVYSSTKLAAILHAIQLNHQYGESHGIYAMAVNPGAVNSDIWRGFPSWMKSIFEKVYLTTQQGSVPLVAAALLADQWEREETVYLQPYWRPCIGAESTTNVPMLPFTEMLGPYVGFQPTKARLPPSTNRVVSAASALWKASEDIVQHSFSKSQKQ